MNILYYTMSLILFIVPGALPVFTCVSVIGNFSQFMISWSERLLENGMRGFGNLLLGTLTYIIERLLNMNKM